MKLISVARRPAVWIPAAVLAAATAACWWTDLDRALIRPFFSGYVDRLHPDRVEVRFPLGQEQPWLWLYSWGVYPAWILGCCGAIVWPLSFAWKRLERWRDPALFYALLLLIGPGIIVNACKPCWQRPRPHATVEFGGPRGFVPAGQRGGEKDDASFPSGHAAMGFYLMAPAFVCYRRRPWLAAAFLALGLCYGGLMGMGRIVAGAHFPSDVLWSAGLVYFTALALAAPFGFGQ